MSEVKSYRDLKIWQRGILLSKQVYELTTSFPKEEVYGMASQMRRCSVSVPSNIAEGFGRSTLSFLNFLKIAHGSFYELDTQLVLTKDLGLSTNTELISALEVEIQETGKMINSFINRLKEKL
ncbi:MAG TPA: four helix bundle protein [Fluviicola sp.]|nr:four helix bundle protein [Fluviicola sp.]